MLAIRHLVCGGWYEDPTADGTTVWTQAGVKVRALANDSTFARLIGLTPLLEYRDKLMRSSSTMHGEYQ